MKHSLNYLTTTTEAVSFLSLYLTECKVGHQQVRCSNNYLEMETEIGAFLTFSTCG